MKFLKAAIPVLLVLFVAWAITAVLKATKPEPEKKIRVDLPPSVEVIQVTPGEFQITIPTRGEVRARTRSVLIPEVPGRIISVAKDFRDGGFFEKDEILVEIDPRDYQTAATVATSNVAEAQNAYAQEMARAAQAEENWRLLGKGKTANDLALRVPQLTEAKARVDSAVARLDQAETDLERTRVRAPYAGRILEQLVDVGQFVNTGTSLARIFAVDYAEVRLPLTSQQAGFIDLPEDFRGDTTPTDKEQLPGVTLTKQHGIQKHSWHGKIIRTESAIDTRTRQLVVVAQVDDPYRRREDGTPPFRIGDFFEAEISGKLMQDVYTIPRTAVREGDKVIVIDAENRLRYREIEIIWGDRDNVVVNQGLAPGDTICTKPPAYASEGAKVAPMPKKAKPQ
jgi:multidrug efflux system membrane fusion protein